jgi:type I restriction enzyme M protein
VQAIVTLWSEDDKRACGAYSRLISAANDCVAHLRSLSEGKSLALLRNPKGKITLKVVKDRLAQFSTGAEHYALKDYVSTDKKQKDASKKADEQFAIIELKFVQRLNESPLPNSLEDLDVVVRFRKLLDRQTILKAKIKEAEERLDQLTYEKYPKLTEIEVKALVVDDKWLGTLATAIQGELDRVSQTLTSRIRLLGDRYAIPLPQTVDDVERLSARVDTLLKKMEAKPIVAIAGKAAAR